MSKFDKIWLWTTLMIWAAASAASAQVSRSSTITIKATLSETAVPKCDFFAKSCGLGGVCPDTVATGTISGNHIGSGNAEIDVATDDGLVGNVNPDGITGCLSLWMDICYSTSQEASGEEIIGEFSGCRPVNDANNTAPLAIGGGYEFVTSPDLVGGWGLATGSENVGSLPAVIKLTLKGAIEQ